MGRQKQLTKVLCIRLTDELAADIEAKAKRLKVRRSDIARMAIAVGMSTDPQPTKSMPGGKRVAD